MRLSLVAVAFTFASFSPAARSLRAAASQVTPSQSATASVAAVMPCCPDEQSYEAVVRAFAHGDRGAASRAIARAPAGELQQAVSKLRGDDETLLEAASVMHLVLALSAVQGGNLPASSLQLQSSGAAFRKLHTLWTGAGGRPMIPRHGVELVPRIDGSPADPLFVGMWYIAATEICLAAADPRSAASIAKLGVSDAEPSGAARLAEGIVSETKADLGDHDRRHRASDLGDAEEAYRQVLTSVPSSEEARLRLGHVLSLEGKGAEARTTLDGLLHETRDARIEYLTHLFLADLAARRKDPDGATQEYLAAVAANPSSQAAYFGLSNLALLAGDEERARAYIRRWSTFPSAPDPWTLYRQGLDQLQPALIALLRTISQ